MPAINTMLAGTFGIAGGCAFGTAGAAGMFGAAGILGAAGIPGALGACGMAGMPKPAGIAPPPPPPGLASAGVPATGAEGRENIRVYSLGPEAICEGGAAGVANAPVAPDGEVSRTGGTPARNISV